MGLKKFISLIGIPFGAFIFTVLGNIAEERKVDEAVDKKLKEHGLIQDEDKTE